MEFYRLPKCTEKILKAKKRYIILEYACSKFLGAEKRIRK